MPPSSSAFDYLVLGSALSRFARAPAELSEAELVSVRADARRQYAVQECILSAPEAAGVVVDGAAVDVAVADITRRYQDEEELDRDLARNRLDREALRQAVARTLRVDAVVERLTAQSAQVSEAELEIYYLQHRDHFRAPESRAARHILITVNERYRENTRRNARRRIDRLAAELSARPERFGDLALRHSECPSAMRGGELGRVTRGKLYPELDKVLFALAEGEISAPIASEVGYHIMQCGRIVAEGPLPFDLVCERIARVVEQRKRESFLRGWLRDRLGSGPAEPLRSAVRPA